MQFKKTLVLSVAAAILSTGMALASPTTDAIVADLQSQNATNIKVRVGMFSIKVKAYINGVKVEQVYTLDGVLKKQETKANGVETTTYYDAAGNVVDTVSGSDDLNGSDDSNDSDHGRGHDSNDDKRGDRHDGKDDSNDGKDDSHDGGKDD